MVKINEATDTDLKIIDELKMLGWKPSDTLIYQQEYTLTPEQQKLFEGRKSIKPDITLTDLNGNIIAIFENKFEDEKKALTKLRTLYATVLAHLSIKNHKTPLQRIFVNFFGHYNL